MSERPKMLSEVVRDTIRISAPLKNSAFQKTENSCRVHRSDGVVPRKSDVTIRLRGLPSLVIATAT